MSLTDVAPISPSALEAPLHQPRGASLRSLARAVRRYPVVVLFGAILLALALVAIFAQALAPYSELQTHPAQALQSPSAAHWLGTDELGRDTLTRVLFGTRISLEVAAIAVGIGAVVGVTLGLVAGYLGGLTDQVISRYIDGQLAFPGLLLAIAVSNALGPSLAHAMIAVGITGIPVYMRLTRGQVLQARELEYVTAARVLGAGRVRIMLRHVLPNVVGPLIVVGSLAAGSAILTEASLSFLGIGAQPPTPDLGSMINTAKDYLENQAWLAVGPGVAIFLIVWSFANIGDALHDALDPRLRRR